MTDNTGAQGGSTTRSIVRERRHRERRDELADAALATLAERGYARTSLRDIAERTELSHGSVHYFFTDRIDLLSYAVRRYKERCATRYDELVDTASSAAQLRAGFATALAVTLCADAGLHRLWYDLRAQAMFEPALRDDVRAIDARLEEMIVRVVERYVVLLRAAGHEDLSAPDPLTAYTAFDGLFEHCLLLHHCADPAAATVLVERASDLIDRLVGRTTS